MHKPHTSAKSLREALIDDTQGAWTASFVTQLQALSAGAAASSAGLSVPELKLRCEVLANGAGLGARLLPSLRERLALGMPVAPLPGASAELISQSTETSLLYELGWLALEAGLAEEGLAVIHAVGTLLHGRLGGAMFKVEALLAVGNAAAAATVLEECLLAEPDPDGVAAATLASLWEQRDERTRAHRVDTQGDKSAQ
jgi:hypothetical protein